MSSISGLNKRVREFMNSKRGTYLLVGIAALMIASYSAVEFDGTSSMKQVLCLTALCGVINASFTPYPRKTKTIIVKDEAAKALKRLWLRKIAMWAAFVVVSIALIATNRGSVLLVLAFVFAFGLSSLSASNWRGVAKHAGIIAITACILTVLLNLL